MLYRLQFLIVYIGSAAMAALIAACLSSPQIATFRCNASGANGAEQCELSAMLTAAVPEAGMMNLENLTPDVPILESAAMAAAH